MPLPLRVSQTHPVFQCSAYLVECDDSYYNSPSKPTQINIASYCGIINWSWWSGILSLFTPIHISSTQLKQLSSHVGVYPHPQISFYWTITWVWIEEKCSYYQSQLSIPFLFLPLFSMICPVWIVWVWKNCNLWQGVFQLASYTTRFKDRKVYIPNWCGIVALVLTSILCLGRQRNGITKHIMNLVWPPTLNFLFISRAFVLSFWCFLLREIKGVGVRCLICSHWNNKWSRWPKSVCTASQWQAFSDTPVWLAKLTTPEATTTTTMIMLATTITAASCWPKSLCTASQALSDTSAISNDNNNRN